MNSIVVIFLVCGWAVVGFAWGTVLARRNNMTRWAWKELEARRSFMANLARRADEHAPFDEFAVVVQEMLADERVM